MFVVAKKRLFWWPVTVQIPDPEKPGVFVKHTFEMQFEAMALDRARQIDADRKALPEAERVASSYDYLFETTKSWRDVVDAENVPVPFSREAYAEQLNYPWFRTGVLAAYEQAVTGQEPRLGN